MTREAAIARASVDKLLVVEDDEAYCQPCVSPVWDTALACHALLEIGGTRRAAQACRRASTGCCRARCSMSTATGPRGGRSVRPGGWAFQYANPHYPDLDDTAVVVMAMDRARRAWRRRPLRCGDRARAPNGSRACRAATAAGRRSTSTTSTTTSTTFPSPTTAR